MHKNAQNRLIGFQFQGTLRTHVDKNLQNPEGEDSFPGNSQRKEAYLRETKYGKRCMALNGVSLSNQSTKSRIRTAEIAQ